MHMQELSSPWLNIEDYFDEKKQHINEIYS